MLTLLRTLSVGYFNQHRTRIRLVVLSIALGVATLVATRALSKGLGTSIQDGVNPLANLADLLVINGETGVPATLAEELRQAKIEGVRDARPFVVWRVLLDEPDNKAKKVLWLIGVEPPKGQKKGETLKSAQDALGVRARQTWEPGAWDALQLLTAPPVFVSENLAQELARKDPKSRTFHVLNAGPRFAFTVLGTLDFKDSVLPLKNSFVVVAELMAASAVCFPDRVGDVHHLAVTLEPGADQAAVQQRIRDWLGPRADVQTVEGSRELVSDVTAGLEVGLAIGGAGALVVGLFLVYNALAVSVAERRHDIGIMRSVGATRRQVAGLFVCEATVMGLAGSLLGLPLGWLLAWLAVKPLAGFIAELLVPIDAARIHLSAGLMAVAVLAGTLVAVLAALVPAVQAASEEPADAVRRVPRRNLVLFAVLQVAAMVVLIGAGFAFAGWRHQLPARVGMFAGIVCLLLGGLVATPLLAQVVGKLAQPLFRHLGLEGRLAADNLVRAPGRTGLVIAALAATGALMVQTAGFLKSTREAIRDWVDEKIAADLFVTSGSAVTSGGASIGMREGMLEQLRGVPGVAAVMPVKFHLLNYRSPVDGGNRIVYVVAIDARTLSEAPGMMLARNVAGTPLLRERGNVLISENFAALYKVKVGDTITLPGRGRDLQVHVVGTVTDYTWNRGTIVMDLQWYREEYGDRQVHVYDLFLSPGADVEAVRAEVLERWGATENLFVLTRPELNADVSRTLNNVYALAYAQQGVVGMVALLGVVSALFISVLQRRRELGLLRAVGASRAQILRSVLAEAVLMGLIGAALGFGIGLLLQWYVLDVMILDEAGFEFPMRIPWLEAGVVMLASVLLATLAGLAPAYQATRLRIPEAIAYE